MPRGRSGYTLRHLRRSIVPTKIAASARHVLRPQQLCIAASEAAYRSSNESGSLGTLRSISGCALRRLWPRHTLGPQGLCLAAVVTAFSATKNMEPHHVAGPQRQRLAAGVIAFSASVKNGSLGTLLGRAATKIAALAYLGAAAAAPSSSCRRIKRQ